VSFDSVDRETVNNETMNNETMNNETVDSDSSSAADAGRVERDARFHANHTSAGGPDLGPSLSAISPKGRKRIKPGRKE
jgi:hypothetical protein